MQIRLYEFLLSQEVGQVSFPLELVLLNTICTSNITIPTSFFFRSLWVSKSEKAELPESLGSSRNECSLLF